MKRGLLILAAGSLIGVATVSAPREWEGTVCAALFLFAITCGPENPWGKRANGEPE